MTPAEPSLEVLLARVDAAGEALRARSRASVARSLGQAVELIREAELPLGHQAREVLPTATGLSLPMVAWALAEVCRSADAEALARLADLYDGRPDREAVPARRSVIVLAGNVFTAGLTPILHSLLSLAPTVVKASSREDLFPRVVQAAIAEVDPELGDALAVVSFPGGSEALERAIFGGADVVHAYGSDRTLCAIRGRLPATTRFVGHGHGLGVLVVPKAALGSRDEARTVAEAASYDIAAYDQRGCLSPHAAIVEEGGAVDGAAFAQLLSDALGERASDLPRGPLPTQVGAAQIQWRGIAAVRGTLHEGDGWAVAHEGGERPRIGPGWRNVQVVDADGLEHAVELVRGFGVHLKAVGVAGPRSVRRRLRAALAPTLAPRVCPVGEVQRPPLLALADGACLSEAFVRWVEVE
ncbi:MAG: acyl-CoA reductase [Sandaracinaceae bacterium]